MCAGFFGAGFRGTSIDEQLTAHDGRGDGATEHRGDGRTARDGHGRALQEHGGCRGWWRVNWVVGLRGDGGKLACGSGFEKWSDLGRAELSVTLWCGADKVVAVLG